MAEHEGSHDRIVALVPTTHAVPTAHTLLDVGPSFHVTATGLVKLRDLVTFDELQQVGHVLDRVEVGVPWWRGDWWR